jgi:hypothetical protein
MKLVPSNREGSGNDHHQDKERNFCFAELASAGLQGLCHFPFSFGPSHTRLVDIPSTLARLLMPWVVLFIFVAMRSVDILASIRDAAQT